MSGHDHRTIARAEDAPTAISWQCRLVQLAMRRLVKPRLTLEHGIAPFRRTLDRLTMILPRPPRGITTAPAVRGGVAGEWTSCRRQHDGPAPFILYFHGGAFVAGAPRLSRAIVWQMAARCGGDAFSADYRLAPEHPFPSALDDAVACHQALVQGGIAPRRIVIAGESAGAALALALALRIKAGPAAGQQPRALVLISPWLDLTLSGSSLAEVHDPGLPVGLMEAARRLYKPDGRYDDPFASPLFGALDGLPPVLAQVGTREILRDDARRLAARLRLAGVEHLLEEWAGMHHVWHHAPIAVPEAERAFDAIAHFIARAGGEVVDDDC